MRVVLLPMILLVMVSAARWLHWKRDNPPVTAADVKVRRIMQNAKSIQFGSRGSLFSPQQRQTLVAHFWVATTPLKATYPKPAGEEIEIFLKLPPGQGRIILAPDVARSYFSIEHWADEPVMGGSPPINISEEHFELHPATNRFLRAWLKANAP